MIKHILTGDLEGNVHYMCNEACGITEGKVARNPDEATCKNCIRANNKLKKNMIIDPALDPEIKDTSRK
jgi:hypothetical protein